jgi:hypothetical protein
MVSEELRDAIELLLRDFSLFRHELGGLEFYGYSTEFRDLLRLCRDFASSTDIETRPSRKAYVFLDDFHGKSSLSRAIAIQAAANGEKIFRFDGTLGPTSKELNILQPETNALVVVDGVPEAADARSTLLDRINLLKGRAILFARPEYINDAHLMADVPTLRITHVDERRLDKVAWIVGLVREHLRDERGVVPQVFAEALAQMPVSALTTLCGVPLGSKIVGLELLATKIAQAVELKVGLRSGPSLSEEDLATIFVEFHSSGAAHTDSGFRLWVEGESDCRMLKLVCRLALPVHGIDLGEGLTITPLGLGRDGGTSKATEVVVNRRTKRNKDIFLFDSDEPGRHAQADLSVLDQEVLFLDSKIACSRVEPDVEIEDFVGLGCLDRFYSAHPELRPEKEVIRYKPPVSRRLVVDGADKDVLMQWLDANAALDDLENLMLMLCEVRSRFSLRNLPAMKDKQSWQSWRRRLIEESNQLKHFGNRPAHWAG